MARWIRYYCKCGAQFSRQRHLNEHIAICNPHWPVVKEDDEHKEITRAVWLDQRLQRKPEF